MSKNSLWNMHITLAESILYGAFYIKRGEREKSEIILVFYIHDFFCYPHTTIATQTCSLEVLFHI
jgi:hypothetical protein